MKTLIGTLTATAILAIGFSAPVAFADRPIGDENGQWSAEKAAQVAVNRCANSGQGNGGEKLNKKGVCKSTKSEEADIDPGNSDN